ncbi:MAG: hypothetical protein C0402_12855 [Thermodesulfovibrio sp.]|nr:hypothetical protein [Thermodesulfovibrio sp.]
MSAVICGPDSIDRAKLLTVIAIILLITGIADFAGAGLSPNTNEYTADGGMFLAPRITTQILPDSAQPDQQSNAVISPLAAPPFSYVNVLGSSFTARDSGTVITYASNGCISLTSGDRVTARLDLPDAAVIKYVRIYYNDTDAVLDLQTWLTTYDPGVTSVDLTTVSSSGSAGYGFAISPEITATVANTSNAYVLIAFLPNSATLRFCGARVAYYPPPYLIIY